MNGSVDAVDVYEDHAVSDDDDSDACSDDEQEDLEAQYAHAYACVSTYGICHTW